MSIEKVGALPRWFVMTLVVIFMAIPLIRPLGLPIVISESTKDFYDTIDKLDPGDVVLFDIGFGAGGYPTLGPASIAVLKHCFSKGLKVVIMATSQEGTMMYPLIMEKVKPEEVYGAKYGEDFVFLGYLAGVQTAMAAVLGDLHSAAPKDYFGTPIGQISMLKDIRGADDIDVVAYITTSGDIAEGWVYQAYSRYGRTTCGGWLSMMTPSLKPYYDAGSLAGMLDGIRGAAEYESLIKEPGDAMKTTDILNLTQSWVLVLIILGNIAYFATRKEGG
ncbi:MAG TPA: hypothetical protein EYP68_02315 [Candidatus Korarchaeota archaeon]|nr:hypothetical protein [Candidatus Korarchaeota archaeon]